MKKILFLLLSAAVAASAVAGVNMPVKRVDQNKSPGIPLVAKDKKFDVKEKRRAVDDRMTGKTMKQSFSAADPNQPEGDLYRYVRSGNAVILTNGTYQSLNQSDTMDIVYGLDGTTVYLKNILYGSNVKYGDYWVQGQLSADGTQITVPMGQRIYHSSSPVINVVLAWGRSSYTVHGTSQRFTFDVNEDVTEAVYLIDGNTITLQDSFTTPGSSDPGFEGTGLGCMGRSGTSDPTFAGFFEWNTVLTFASFTPNIITEIPDNCAVHVYKRNSACIFYSFNYLYAQTTDGFFRVAFDRDNQPDVYIQDLSWYHSDFYDAHCWVKGTYDRWNHIITIPTGQYLSWNDKGGYGAVLGWGSTQVDTIVNGNGEEQHVLNPHVNENVTEIQMRVDGEDIYMLGTQGDVNAEYPDDYIATGMMTYWNDDHSFTSIEFCNRDESGNALPWGMRVIEGPAVPANPTADEWYDCGDESGYSRFFYTLPETDVNGNFINPECLSYSIFLDDDQIFTFDEYTYSYDTHGMGDITEVPYNIYSHGYDFRTGYVYFYRTNHEGYEPLFTWRIGIQVYYTVDGVSNASDVVYLEVFPNPNVNIGDVNNDSAVNIADVTSLIDYLLGSASNINEQAADVNQDKVINIADVTALIDKLLSGN
jgi:hypothetical protein